MKEIKWEVVKIAVKRTLQMNRERVLFFGGAELCGHKMRGFRSGSDEWFVEVLPKLEQVVDSWDVRNCRALLSYFPEMKVNNTLIFKKEWSVGLNNNGEWCLMVVTDAVH
jgi:hypothetical protein